MSGDAHTGLLVSIITPTFNSAAFLPETIASIARQTYASIEHIVVDGGSTDGTLDMLKKQEHIRWISERDEGMYDAINKGLRMSSGAILAYLNADDLYFPDTVERIVAFFQRAAKADLVYSDCRYIDEHGETLFTRKYPPFRWNMYAVLDGSTVPQQTCFWRRRVHDAVGYFDPGFRMAGDFEFIMRAGRTCTVTKIPGPPLAQFRFHPAMQTIQRKTINDGEIRTIHGRYGIYPSLRTTILKIIATARYRMTNYHRVRDKFANLLSGKTPAYRP